jgi:hypothetical protein
MPVRIHYHYTPIRLHTNRMIANLVNRINKWWERCVMEWAEAIQGRIVVDTGMSASSLAPLMEDVGGVGSGRMVIGDRIRKGVTDISGKYHPNLYKSPEQGAIYGQDAYVYSLATLSKMNTFFQYKMQVYQWAFWEPGWRTNDDAVEAFRKAAKRTSGMTEAFTKTY